MPTYAIGDLQGCFDELQDLLNEINFDSRNDQLLFTGDLVNRGPKSLECLRFVKELGNQARTVLGNHDLHLLAVANDVRSPHRKDTFDEILDDRDRENYLAWICKLPFMLKDESTGFYLLHAGLFPQWSISQALELAHETEQLLQTNQFGSFVKVMYGDEPDAWSDSLQGFDRIRCIINSFTRMRYIDKQGKMNFSEKTAPGKHAKDLTPWFQYPDRKTKKQKIIFGHWSTIYLGEKSTFSKYNVYPLDTGCMWGGKLTALRLEDEKWFSVPSRQEKIFK